MQNFETGLQPAEEEALSIDRIPERSYLKATPIRRGKYGRGSIKRARLIGTPLCVPKQNL